MRIQRLALLFIILFLYGCESHSPTPPQPLFAQEVPQNSAFKSELQFLETTNRLSKKEIQHIEEQLKKVEDSFGVPKALLWCVLFQESRFDSFKNANSKIPAKGLGQFTPSALEEINSDTNQYDPRTREVLNQELKPGKLPLNFKLKPPVRDLASRRRRPLYPPQPSTSYYRTATAVFASASYLNNRFQQLKKALDRQKIPYDPQILWLYAAAAYNKGSRSIFLLLTNEYMSRGESALQELLKSPKATYLLLTHPERLDYSLREVWTKKTRTKYIIELLRNMEVISSCALTEQHL
jgi:hypothetical protein